MDITDNWRINSSFGKKNYIKTRDIIRSYLNVFNLKFLKKEEALKNNLRKIFFEEFMKDDFAQLELSEFHAFELYFEALANGSEASLSQARAEFEKNVRTKQAQYFDELWQDMLDEKKAKEEALIDGADPYAILALERAGFFDSHHTKRGTLWG